jgi:hypothetical protein
MTALTAGLQAAFRLARGRPDGLAPLQSPGDPDMAVAARSYVALAACVPLEFVQGLLNGIGGYGLAQDVMVAVVGWLSFALVSHRVARNAGRSALWPRYIAAWNWCSLLQSVMLVLGLATTTLGLPAWLPQTIVLVIVGWALWLEYFVARVALGFGGLQAAALVALDFAISQVASGVMDQLR